MAAAERALRHAANGARSPRRRPRIHALSGAGRCLAARGAIDRISSQRIEDYAIKAAREGKLETSWLNPDEAYEKALRELRRARSSTASARRVSSIRSISRAGRRCSVR